MFVDEQEIRVKAGKGGDGVVSFRKEKFIPFGGPDGGDGGDGGDVLLLGRVAWNTLGHLRSKSLLRAQNGQNGSGQNKKGKKGQDCIIEVPLGTIVKDPITGETLTEVEKEGQTVLLAEGSKGGHGNRYFLSSRDRSPHVSQKSEETPSLDFFLELRLIAHVALIGFPNAGKSTFLTKVSNSKVRIADYPFTTLEPHLGVVDEVDGWYSYVMADIPGLMEGSHRGVGLGTRFLKHIERCRAFLFVLDLSSSMSCWEQFKLLQKELFLYNQRFIEKDYWVVLNKIDLLDSEEQKKQQELFFSLFQQFNSYESSSYDLDSYQSKKENTLKSSDSTQFSSFSSVPLLPRLFLASALKNQGLEEIKKALFDQLFE